jgi:hypothetical protein
VIVELIATTQTSSGLRVRAELDLGRYPLGVKVSDRELAAVPLRRHDWHGEWNYTAPPAAAQPHQQSNWLYATKRGARPRSLAVGVSLPHNTAGRH